MFHLFTLFNIPVNCHWSTLLFLLGIAVINPPTLPIILITFLCVIPHEYGHILWARRYGIDTDSILLLPIGGIALLKSIPREPIKEILIALAGPAVSLALALIALPIFLAYPTWLTLYFLSVNTVITLFNLLPIIPMDGGRVFRALLNYITDYETATLLAVRTSQVLGGSLALLGLLTGQLALAITMIFIIIIAQAEYKQMKNEV